MQLTITPNFAQERALNQLRRNWKDTETFMVYSPTGSGKTGLAAFIVAGFVREGANKQVISSQADSLIKISRIWADFFPANTSNQPI